MYCFLVKCNIPKKRLTPLQLREWQTDIHAMLRRIPFISPEDKDTYILIPSIPMTMNSIFWLGILFLRILFLRPQIGIPFREFRYSEIFHRNISEFPDEFEP